MTGLFALMKAICIEYSFSDANHPRQGHLCPFHIEARAATQKLNYLFVQPPDLLLTTLRKSTLFI